MRERQARAHENPSASCAGEIARAALRRGLIQCHGKTPEATMASALYSDVKRKEGASAFVRPHEGLFGLREWLRCSAFSEARRSRSVSVSGQGPSLIAVPRFRQAALALLRV